MKKAGKKCNSELRQCLSWESEMVYQKTRAEWLKVGDRNTIFFHFVIRERRWKNMISLQETNGEVIQDTEAICDLAAHFFGELFSASPFIMHEELFDHYPTKISTDMNNNLCMLPTL